jgi:DNA-binding NarL/FixJ family response regulator
MRKIIEQNPDLVVVAACTRADDALLAVQEHQPDVVVLDLRLPDRDGVELIRDIVARCRAKIVVFTVAREEARIIDALRNGADDIVFKDPPASMLVSAVRRLLIAGACMKGPIAASRRPCIGIRGGTLSAREREIAQWVAAGARNKEIAWKLGISEGTVKLHLFHAYRKLKVVNRVGLLLARDQFL